MTMTVCPKCECSDIDTGWPLSAGKITYKSDRMKFMSIGGLCKAYVCMNCGYIESYVETDYLKKIKAQA